MTELRSGCSESRTAMEARTEHSVDGTPGREMI
jgi:hypothetical protein